MEDMQDKAVTEKTVDKPIENTTEETAEKAAEQAAAEKKTQTLEAEGFVFYTQKDAELARQERKKVIYLKTHMNYKKPESVLNLYEKAIRERIFKTPVGLVFLKEIQNYLVKSPEIENEKIMPIPLFVTYDGEMRDHTSPARRRVQPSAPKKKESPALPISVCLNIVLVIAVIAMFFITLTADQPNILNYENALLNKYAGWEQELTEREQAIRQAEQELRLGND